MTQDKAQQAQDNTGSEMRAQTPRDGKKTKPEWADGLRQLYDSVVNEPLPDSFADLISKLDEGGK